MRLEKILGFTTSGRNSFVGQPDSGRLIYLAGCVIVVLDPKLKTQSYLVTNCKQSLTTLAISEDGRYLAAADCGAKAWIHIWDLSTQSRLAHFVAHQVEIYCMSFSTDGQLLVSVGSQQDSMISVWDWRRQSRLASHKVPNKIRAISFSADSSYFVTVGDAHVKYWHIQQTNGSTNQSAAQTHLTAISPPDQPMPAISISSRTATLGDQKWNSFCDVKCGRGSMSGSTYCITKSGILCELNNRRLLHKWVDLRAPSANCLGVSESLIVIGCANGITRCFNTAELRFIKNFPKPHRLGSDQFGLCLPKRKQTHLEAQKRAQYAQSISISLNETRNTVACIYSDRSIYVWDFSDQNRVTNLYSALYHSSCIWGIDMYPPITANTKKPSAVLPIGTFITCSSDDTVRIWSPSNYRPERRGSTPREGPAGELTSSLIKIFFTDQTHKYLCDLEMANAEDDDDHYDNNEGLRCLKISPDGKHVAAGNRSGGIRVFDLEADTELKYIAAHDAEVLCLEYSDPSKFSNHSYLASSSRDKLIHIFDAANGYTFLQTIDDHSSSITCLRFVNNRARDCLQLVSCGADQKIIFRKGFQASSGQLNFVTDQYIEGKNTFYDMEVDSESSCLMAACQDRMIRLFNVAQVKYQTGFKGSPPSAAPNSPAQSSGSGTLIKIALDPSCTFLATSCTDKSISIYDYQRGECIASLSEGLSDLVTDLKFSPDGRHLIACTGDGCVLIYSSPAEMANAVSGAGNLIGGQLSVSSCSLNSFGNEINNLGADETEMARLKSLPKWAKLQLLDEIGRGNLRQTGPNLGSDFSSGPSAISRFEVQQGARLAANEADLADPAGCSLRLASGDSNSPAEGCPSDKSASQPANRRLSRDGGLVSSMAKLFQSRENIDRISSRAKIVSESLTLEKETMPAGDDDNDDDDDHNDEEASPICRRYNSRSAKSGSLSGRFNSGADQASTLLAANSSSHENRSESCGGEANRQRRLAAAAANQSANGDDANRPARCELLGQAAAPLSGSSLTVSCDATATLAQSASRFLAPKNSPAQSDRLRSSRSECNLSRSGANKMLQSSGSSRLDGSPPLPSYCDHNNNNENENDAHDLATEKIRKVTPTRCVLCEKLDLTKLDPSSAELSERLCKYVVEELQSLSKYTTRLHQCLQASREPSLANLLARGVQNSMDILSIVPPARVSPSGEQQRHRFQSQVNLAADLGAQAEWASSARRRKMPETIIGGATATARGRHHHRLSGSSSALALDTVLANTKLGSQTVARPGGVNYHLSGQSVNKSERKLHIDQVLEAYSDRLFKMVQDKMASSSSSLSPSSATLRHSISAANQLASMTNGKAALASSPP